MKKIFAYVLTLAILFSMTHLVGADYADYTEQPTVTLFGEGTTIGDSAATPALLSDGFQYNYKDYKDLSERPSAKLEKFVKFTQVDSGVQFQWENKQVVNRLELWIWRLGSINQYEVQTSENGTTWTAVKTGNFDQAITTPADTSSNNA